ncbi:MAG: YbaK/EbsC family protein [Phycisphaerae bacterium]|nr:YbaK/EbsC family protein [Phycisphaerae bacterium]
MRVVDFLEKFEADYTLEQGRPVFRAREVINHRCLGGIDIAKAVVIRADGKKFMCVLPSCCTMDLTLVRNYLGARSVDYVDEREMRDLFPNCQTGAEPPFGALYGFPTLMDASLENDEYIAFQGETYDTAIVMRLAEYERLAGPRVFSFACPAGAATEMAWR